ncbi:4-(cytidine 5'-diphospho)-2-C-methyl-D-erythritol kinase [Neotabrizicola sp. VNH66]|uniref:4-(cytidine 5'-diphospho)-2-C-methyl-D-erythritol kinase n=1 Tax=Neotabrizicola sp. VNH66 TaxID=3400918 RepID=UPI003C0F93A9
MATEPITEFAPAKINLCLHVTGRRADGYHLLDSLVVFAGVGDRVTVAPGAGFRVTGPQAVALAAEGDNLCLRAARAMGAEAAITLEKVLPVASGIGGGSADAAAVLRALARMGHALPAPAAVLALGADVPVCLAGRPVRMRGVGEVLEPVRLPPVWAVLVNPGVAVSTPAIFRALARRDNPPLPVTLPPLPDAAALAVFLASQRNDLAPAAEGLAPLIAEVRTALAATPGCLLARMSGSGATCFGLYRAERSARDAATALRAARHGWWVEPALLAGSD